MTLRFTPRARNDLRDILEYIAKENPAAPTGYVGRSSMPPSSSLRDLISGFATQKFRSCVAALPPDTHTAFITASKDTDVWIIHIRHSARRPWNEEA